MTSWTIAEVKLSLGTEGDEAHVSVNTQGQLQVTPETCVLKSERLLFPKQMKMALSVIELGVPLLYI